MHRFAAKWNLYELTFKKKDRKVLLKKTKQNCISSFSFSTASVGQLLFPSWNGVVQHWRRRTAPLLPERLKRGFFSNQWCYRNFSCVLWLSRGTMRVSLNAVWQPNCWAWDCFLHGDEIRWKLSKEKNKLRRLPAGCDPFSHTFYKTWRRCQMSPLCVNFTRDKCWWESKQDCCMDQMKVKKNCTFVYNCLWEAAIITLG